MQRVEGNIVDVLKREIYPGVIIIEDGKISDISRNTKSYNYFISPGFIDAHVHIESSMLTPENFSRLVIRKGTVAIVSDPHEIANVLGIDGVQFMVENKKKSLIKISYTIPSCVPATPLDISGGALSSKDIEKLSRTGTFVGLSEVMNVPGVLGKDPEVMAKIESARRYHLKIDGHAPGLSGDILNRYVANGISTDHECTTFEEAKEKILAGMHILIREGSAAKNYEALKLLIQLHSDNVMFCTDDSHPDELIMEGHIDKIVKRAVADGFDLFDVLKIATVNPVKHYQLPVGLLQVGDPADFIIIEDLNSFCVLSSYIDGVEKYNNGEKLIPPPVLEEQALFTNRFEHDYVTVRQISISVAKEIIAIKVIPDELTTTKAKYEVPFSLQNMESDLSRDILKIVYLNRYRNGEPQVAFINGFHLKRGAFASSVSHDSHNILAVGTNDQDLIEAINDLIRHKGGLVVKDTRQTILLPLPIAGIMSDKSGEEVALLYKQMNQKLKEMGCPLKAPFMTLSFMSLLVIPELRIGEKGLFDFNAFDFIAEK